MKHPVDKTYDALFTRPTIENAYPEHVKALIPLFKVFGQQNNSDRRMEYAKTLGELNYSPIMINKATDEISRTFNQLPSLAELLNYLSSINRQNCQKYTNSLHEQAKSELSKERAILAEFRALFGEDEKTLKKYVATWLNKIYGYSKEDLVSMVKLGFTLKAFVRPALFDLKEANWDAEKAFKIGMSKIKSI